MRIVFYLCAEWSWITLSLKNRPVEPGGTQGSHRPNLSSGIIIEHARTAYHETCGTMHQQPYRRCNSPTPYYKWNIAQARPMSMSYDHAACKAEFQPPIGRTHSWSFSMLLLKRYAHVYYSVNKTENISRTQCTRSEKNVCCCLFYRATLYPTHRVHALLCAARVGLFDSA